MIFRRIDRDNGRTTQFATHFPYSGGRFDLDPETHMFLQDIKLGVIPLRHQIEANSNFRVEVRGDISEVEKVQSIVRMLSARERYSFDEMFFDVMENIIQQMTSYGWAVHEIAVSPNEISGFKIVNFTGRRLFKVFGIYIQLVPKADWDLWKRRVSVAISDDIWAISIPNELGGRRAYRSILSKLSRVNHLGPGFWRENVGAAQRWISFDFRSYVREADIFYSYVTNRWGWNRRDLTQNNWTEFYQMYRTLTFKAAQARLRGHIVAEFNELLRRLFIDAVVVINGLPTPEEILEARSKMAAGELHFMAAYKAASL